MKYIHILYGGISTEHEISLKSALNVINSLDRNKYIVTATYIDKNGKFINFKQKDSMDFSSHVIDRELRSEDLILNSDFSIDESLLEFYQFVILLKKTAKNDDIIVIPVIHGQYGEDGKIQGFLEVLGLPYVGCSVVSSAVCMDKGLTNLVLKGAGIPQSDFEILSIKEYLKFSVDERKKYFEYLFQKLGETVFVKPCNNGSSIGVSKANINSIEQALNNAFNYDDRILIEQCIVGVELEVSIIGNDTPIASRPGSYTTQQKVLDYDAKYNDPQLIENVPHILSNEKEEELRSLALKTYHILECSGLSRVDIFMDNYGKFYVNEVNTFPGMTKTSLAHKIFTICDGISLQEYLDKVIEYGIEKNIDKKRSRTTR